MLNSLKFGFGVRESEVDLSLAFDFVGILAVKFNHCKTIKILLIYTIYV